MEQLIATGAVTRGWVGVELQEITPELADSFKLGTTAGVLIAGVQRGSPADRAGIKPGDIVVTVDGKPVGDPDSMRNLIVALAPGRQVTLGLKRGQNNLDLQVSVGKRPVAPRQAE
jgi:serine protease DegS/serine protease DegQ